MDNNVTERDEGKKVVDAGGDEIGIISGVRGGTAYVDPSPGLRDSLRSKLGWDSVDENDYPLDETYVDRITDDEIHLRKDM